MTSVAIICLTICIEFALLSIWDERRRTRKK